LPKDRSVCRPLRIFARGFAALGRAIGVRLFLFEQSAQPRALTRRQLGGPNSRPAVVPPTGNLIKLGQAHLSGVRLFGVWVQVPRDQQRRLAGGCVTALRRILSHVTIFSPAAVSPAGTSARQAHHVHPMVRLFGVGLGCRGIAGRGGCGRIRRSGVRADGPAPRRP
jgi:hypothetical protein